MKCSAGRTLRYAFARVSPRTAGSDGAGSAVDCGMPQATLLERHFPGTDFEFAWPLKARFPGRTTDAQDPKSVLDKLGVHTRAEATMHR